MTAICPTCLAPSDFLLDWQYSGLNDSIFNYTAQFHHCCECGLVFVNNIDDKQLAQFYNDECSYSEKAHFDIDSPANIAKYECYREVLIEHGLEHIAITDIGCGRGGFILWLNKQAWQANCYGIEVDVRSLPSNQAVEKTAFDVEIAQGFATALPYLDESQKVLTYFHVFEHIRDIDAVLNEAHRVLENEGHILIEVPDAENYAKQPVGSAFWFGIREHIYHFSAHALMSALKRHGFDVIKVRRGMLPTPEFEYPSLMILATKTDRDTAYQSAKGNDIADFAKQSQFSLQQQADRLNKLSVDYSKLTFWGCSAELFSLLPLITKLDYQLCDVSHVKQQSLYFDKPIFAPSVVEKEGMLVVAPYLHSDKIKQAACDMGWQHASIYTLS